MLVAFALILNATVHTFEIPPTGGKNSFYGGTAAPLAPAPFRKLPIGSIKPDGWLLKQLRLEGDGFTGHLTEISDYLQKGDNAWLTSDGRGEHPWEEVPYWLKGFGDLGYVLGDERIIKEAKFWVDHVLAAQEPDGWLGPRINKAHYHGRPDMWPNMIMLDALESYYEYSNDPRVIEALSRYFKWQLSVPDKAFFVDECSRVRCGDNLASVYWLYDRTKEKWLLDLAQKIDRHGDNWQSGIPSWHGVNFAQGFREPAEYGLLAHDGKYLAATLKDYLTMHQLYGQVPGGLYAADEDARPGYADPRQATETCAMVEMMHSSELLLREYGSARWAETCEDVAFNSLPASMTPNLKALHYLTAPNMVITDGGNKSPGLEDAGAMLIFNPWDYRCCQHNVAQGWPYFSENLWYGVDDNGLGAAIYAPCHVRAKVGNGEEATIAEETDYPFEESIRFKMTLSKPVRFPLVLRLPNWCKHPSLLLNGTNLPIRSLRAYARIDNEWKSGDVLELRLPMEITVQKWAPNHGAVSIERGPLAYSLRIGEEYVRNGGTDEWPAVEIHPTTDWNYGLTLGKFELIKNPMPLDEQPFDENSVPLEIKTTARKIAEWCSDDQGLVGKLQDSPARSDLPDEIVTLIPMGAARLRISEFPTVTSAASGHVWTPEKE